MSLLTDLDNKKRVSRYKMTRVKEVLKGVDFQLKRLENKLVLTPADVKARDEAMLPLIERRKILLEASKAVEWKSPIGIYLQRLHDADRAYLQAIYNLSYAKQDYSKAERDEKPIAMANFRPVLDDAQAKFDAAQADYIDAMTQAGVFSAQNWMEARTELLSLGLEMSELKVF